VCEESRRSVRRSTLLTSFRPQNTREFASAQ
jgi:hypothetical protein